MNGSLYLFLNVCVHLSYEFLLRTVEVGKVIMLEFWMLSVIFFLMLTRTLDLSREYLAVF